MTRRDYFAAHAPITWQDAVEILDFTGECVGPWPASTVLGQLALLRAAYADEMVKALKQSTPE